MQKLKYKNVKKTNLSEKQASRERKSNIGKEQSAYCLQKSNEKKICA